jgi:hypothetical protein
MCVPCVLGLECVPCCAVCVGVGVCKAIKTKCIEISIKAKLNQKSIIVLYSCCFLGGLWAVRGLLLPVLGALRLP